MSEHQAQHHIGHMKPWHRAISVLAISLISFVGLESLIYINNLYQPQLYVETSAYVYLFLLIWMHFIFDLHFRERDISAGSLWRVFVKRFRHFMKWEYFRFYQNYLILPGILYWGAIILIGINFGHVRLQQFIAVVTSVALILSYTFFKEIFRSKDVPISNNHFVILTYVKLYASWLIYSGSLGIVWYYCFSPNIFYLVIFLVTLALLYQALFQFNELRLKNFILIAAISLALSAASIFVYKYWNVNYFSAGLFMTALYNFLWVLLYHTIKKTLTWKVIIEQVAILVLILVMVFGVTDFKSRIDRCEF